MNKFFALTALTLTLSNTFADDTAKVEVGKPAPDFTVTGIDGKTFKLSDKLKAADKNIVLMFNRAHWCPFCMGQVVEMQKQAETFAKLNAEPVIIFREESGGPDGLKKVKEKTSTTFTLALDYRSASTKAYSSAEGAFDTYVIDGKGIVRAAISGTKKDRATAGEAIKVLKDIEGK